MGPQFLVPFMVAEHVKDTPHHGVRHGTDGPLLPTADGEALIEGRERRVLGPHGRMGELGQDRPEGAMALAGFARALLARTYIIPWGHPGPGGQARRGLKARDIAIPIS